MYIKEENKSILESTREEQKTCKRKILTTQVFAQIERNISAEIFLKFHFSKQT
jgi:hypothetical protein